MQCRSCKADIPEGSKFCLECGSALFGRCPSCGKVNPASAKFCLECGHRLPATAVDAAATPTTDTAIRQPSQVGSAERRQLTVMICDLVGSTALSARLDPEDMREIMSAYHHCCAEVIAGLADLSPSTWAMGCWPISAIRKPKSMMPSGRFAPGLCPGRGSVKASQG